MGQGVTSGDWLIVVDRFTRDDRVPTCFVMGALGRRVDADCEFAHNNASEL